METKKEYKCEICNKKYASYQTLWAHTKKFHKKIEKTYGCKYCNNIYKHLPSKYRHEKMCDGKNSDNNKTKKDIKPENKENDFDIFKTNNNISNNCDSYSYIYLLQSLDINTNETTYKIGRTSRNINERLKEYSKCCKILLIVYVPNSIEIEKQLLNILKNDTKIFHNKKIGFEYFCCDNYLYIYNIVLNNIIGVIN